MTDGTYWIAIFVGAFLSGSLLMTGIAYFALMNRVFSKTEAITKGIYFSVLCVLEGIMTIIYALNKVSSL